MVRDSKIELDLSLDLKCLRAGNVLGPEMEFKTRLHKSDSLTEFSSQWKAYIDVSDSKEGGGLMAWVGPYFSSQSPTQG